MPTNAPKNNASATNVSKNNGTASNSNQAIHPWLYEETSYTYEQQMDSSVNLIYYESVGLTAPSNLPKS